MPALSRFPVIRAALAMAACCPLLAGGCGPKPPALSTVSGKVFVNGKPAEHATVVFHPTAADQTLPKPRGTVGPDGTYTLTTTTTGDGAPPGEYRVTVEWWLANPKSDDGPTSRLPAAYARPETSGLTATVAGGPTEVTPIDLKVKR